MRYQPCGNRAGESFGKSLCQVAPARERLADKGFLGSFRGGLFDQADDPQYVEGLGERERPLAAIERDDRRDADARERRMLLLRHVLGLAAADRFRHDRRPVHRAYDFRIFAH